MNFFIIVDNSGIIENVNWCTQKDLLHRGQPLTEVLGEKNTSMILNDQKDSINKNCCKYLLAPVSIDNKIFYITIHSLSIEHQLLVFGFEFESENQIAINESTKIYNSFINEMRSEFKKAIVKTEESVREQFEEIHKLNNQLTNAQRQLKKANAQLEEKNKELNIILVKDALTGLVGRYQFWLEIEKMISLNPGKLGVFSFIDIDNFKSINDQYGHLAGDKFLIEFANRMNKITVDNTIKIRIGGDEFALFTYGLDEVNKSTFDLIWDSIKTQVLDKPMLLNDENVKISSSVGMAVYGVDSVIISELIEYADFAMYKAKMRGKGKFSVFSLPEFELQKNGGNQI